MFKDTRNQAEWLLFVSDMALSPGRLYAIALIILIPLLEGLRLAIYDWGLFNAGGKTEIEPTNIPCKLLVSGLYGREGRKGGVL